jgi:tetratricopeptide (TPR) repeat protein
MEATRPEIWHNQAEVLGRLQRHAEAVPCFDKALALAPDYALAWFGTARALLNRGHQADSAAACRKYVEMADSQDALVPTAEKMLILCEDEPQRSPCGILARCDRSLGQNRHPWEDGDLLGNFKSAF